MDDSCYRLISSLQLERESFMQEILLGLNFAKKYKIFVRKMLFSTVVNTYSLHTNVKTFSSNVHVISLKLQRTPVNRSNFRHAVFFNFLGPSQTVATTPKIPINQARSDEDEDDSSITWIIVVTVVFSLLVCVAVVYAVRKWNQRYSGDFQVNKKPIGPAGTIVHYQDAAHKEKQRQMRL